MSPQEILGLIAEAAGTKMYESKKEAAMKTIEKKQAKVEEIQKVTVRVCGRTCCSVLCPLFSVSFSLPSALLPTLSTRRLSDTQHPDSFPSLSRSRS